MFNLYPYTDFHELNLDMILRMMKDLHKEWTDFEAVNKITNAGAWDITKQYQAWTVVSDNNIGYISLKPVPVGVAINNTEYWGVIADYNILITDLSNRISILEAEVININNRIDNLDDTPWIIVSDSYGTTYANDPGDDHTFYDYMRTATGRTVDNLVGQAYGGEGFIKTYDGKNFLDSFTVYTNSATAAFKNTVSKIVVAAGRNDYESAEDDIVAAIGNFVTYCKANYPNATVYTMFIANGNGIWNGTKSQIQTVYNAYCRSGEVGATYISGGEAILKQQASMASDGVHPSSLGKQYLGRFVAEGVINGYVNVYYPEITIALANNDMWSGFDLASFPLKTTLAGNNIIITPPKITSIHANTYFTPDTTTDLIVGSYVANRNFYVFLDDVYLPVRIDLKDHNGNYITDTSASLRITPGNQLKIRIFQSPSVHDIQDIIVMANGSAVVPAAMA